MKKTLVLLLMSLMVLACKKDQKNTGQTDIKQEEIAYASFGMEIIADDALAADRMAVHYEGMAVGDTVPAKMVAKVEEVCQAKGCWMVLKLNDDEEVMVRFKDYGFFMPKDIAGKEVVVNGIAFVSEMSVEEQRHYAEDKGETKEAIEAITSPKKTYSFEADGVLLKQ